MKADVSLELFLNKDASVLEKHILLLKAVEKTKSITKAAEEVGISYKNAWDSLDGINNRSKKPLIIRVDGKKKNSGSELSDYAKKLINTYEVIQKAQKAFLDEICKLEDISDENLMNLQRMGMKLSARNQLLVEITDITTGAVNSQVVAKLSSGEILRSTITIESEKNLNLRIGKEVLFIFKAPSVIIAKDDDKSLNLSASNQIKGTIKEAKIGAVNAEITIETKGHQTITASITKDSAMEMKLGVGDEVVSIIKANQIIIGA